jgi:hypothetical protein
MTCSLVQVAERCEGTGERVHLVPEVLILDGGAEPTNGILLRQNPILLPPLRGSLDPQVRAARICGARVSAFGDGVAIPVQ